MRQGKGRIASNGIHEVLSGFFQQFGIAGGAALVALEELGIGKGVAAVTDVTLQAGLMQRTVQRLGDLRGDVIHGFEWAIQVESKTLFEVTTVLEIKKFD